MNNNTCGYPNNFFPAITSRDLRYCLIYHLHAALNGLKIIIKNNYFNIQGPKDL